MWSGNFCLILIYLASCDAVNLKCKYGNVSGLYNNIDYNLKRCYVDGEFVISSRDSIISLINEGSVDEKSSINYFEAYDKIIKFIPQNLGEIFENMINLEIRNCELSEIRQNDLKQFPKLKILILSQNPIEYLEANVFKFNPNLNWIIFYKNKIKFIDPQTFNGLFNLEYLDLEHNDCIHKEATGIYAVQSLISETTIKCQNSILANFLKRRAESDRNESELENRNDEIDVLRSQLNELQKEIKKLKDQPCECL